MESDNFFVSEEIKEHFKENLSNSSLPIFYLASFFFDNNAIVGTVNDLTFRLRRNCKIYEIEIKTQTSQAFQFISGHSNIEKFSISTQEELIMEENSRFKLCAYRIFNSSPQDGLCSLLLKIEQII